MEKFKICSVKLNKPDKLIFSCPNYINLISEDHETIGIFGKRICHILNKYIDIFSEEIIFASYIDEGFDGSISMDIDRLINQRLTHQERQNLADLSAMILKVFVKYNQKKRG